jgi:hypothetical protein
MSHIPPISMKASTTISAYRIVTAVTGTANTVKVPASASEVPIGISQDTVLDTGAALPIAVAGISKLYFNDTVTSGSFVASNNAGQGVPHANVTAGSYVIGVLIGPAVAATGTIADVLIQPMFKSIP